MRVSFCGAKPSLTRPSPNAFTLEATLKGKIWEVSFFFKDKDWFDLIIIVSFKTNTGILIYRGISFLKIIYLNQFSNTTQTWMRKLFIPLCKLSIDMVCLQMVSIPGMVCHLVVIANKQCFYFIKYWLNTFLFFVWLTCNMEQSNQSVCEIL